MDTNQPGNDPIPVTAGEQPPRWRRRSRSGAGSSRSGRGRGSSRGKRLSFQQGSERLNLAAIFLLGLCAAGLAGFVLGKKAPAKDHGEPAGRPSEIVPTSEAEGKLDDAFSELHAGNARKALLAFQDVRSLQPGLHGIDFLVGYAASFAGEPALARDSFQTAIGKKELEEESGALLSLLDVSKDGGDGAASLADPVASAESALRRYASARPLDPRAYFLCAEMLRSKGSYRSSVELMSKALGRTDPRFDSRLIEAKMTLAKLQEHPPKEVPAFSSVTVLDGPGALAAAYAALSNHRSEEGVLFLERASEFYPGFLFAELMKDQAFDEFRTDSKFGEFVKRH